MKSSHAHIGCIWFDYKIGLQINRLWPNPLFLCSSEMKFPIIGWPVSLLFQEIDILLSDELDSVHYACRLANTSGTHVRLIIHYLQIIEPNDVTYTSGIVVKLLWLDYIYLTLANYNSLKLIRISACFCQRQNGCLGHSRSTGSVEQ